MARILLIGQKKDDTKGLARLLWRGGHRTDLARSDSVLLRMVLSRRPDLLVMSVPDPVSTLRAVARAVGSRIRQIPAIAIIPSGGPAAPDGDAPGLLDPLPVPFSDETFLARVNGLLKVREVLYGGEGIPDRADPVRRDTSDPSMASRLAALLSKLRFIGPRKRDIKDRPAEPYLQTTASIVNAVEGRDAFDPGHGRRVSAHCAAIAAYLRSGEEETELLLNAASVHDIGKIALSAELLRKPSLSEDDRRLLKSHPRRGAQLIRALTPYGDAADFVLYHHERPDGKGYYGRLAEQVPVPARVLSVADVFDGMTTSRAGPALTPSQAIEILRAGSGAAYDADCVEALAVAVRPQRTTVPLSPLTPLRGR